jgi:hypothetical protein
MRNWLVSIVLLTLFASISSGCATRRCVEEYSTMANNQVIRGDGELLQQLVDKRRSAAEALEETTEGDSRRDDLVFSVQAWELAISLVVQLQNLSRREDHSEELATHRELTTNIRCEARSWALDDDDIVGQRAGQRLLGYARELEIHFGERGRPSDIQLSAISEGREIYMGPVEEEVDVPETDEGTGPGSQDESDDGAESPPADEASSAVDDLLGEE